MPEQDYEVNNLINCASKNESIKILKFKGKHLVSCMN